MKILYLNGNLGAGGAEKLIYDMVLELKKREIFCDVAILTNKNTVYKNKIEEVGIKVYVLSKISLYSIYNIFKLIKLIRNNNYDIVHAHTFPSLYIAALASFFCKKTKFIYTEHSTNNRRRNKKYFKVLDRWIYSRYNILVSITKKVEEELKNWINLKKNYKIIGNGIDLDKYLNSNKKNRKDFGFKEEDKLICQVARFSKIKTHETSVEALRILPDNFKLIFLGEGAEEDRIKKLVQQYNLEERVRFLGYRVDVPEIIKMCDISLLTSRYEGLPISAIESMILTPFIGSDVDGIRELVGGYGELFEYGNFRELSEKIQDIIYNKYRYTDLKEKCYERAVEFDIKNIVSEYLNCYVDKIE